ncbi:MAG: RNA-binding domain-containing protein [Sulfolobales archaeon]
MFILRVETEVRPTESLDKVSKAIKNVLDVELVEVELSEGYRLLVGESNSLESLRKLHQALRQHRILDSARAYMLKNRKGNSLELKLHKQAAFAGRISLVTYDEESPLGPIRVLVVSDKIDELVDWLAPPTTQGRPIWEKPPPKV